MKCCCCEVDLTKVPASYRFSDSRRPEIMACTMVCMNAFNRFEIHRNQMKAMWEGYFKGDPGCIRKIAGE